MANQELAMNHKELKKYKSPLKAIREKCIECMGGRESDGYVKRISECVSADCPTYDFRFGKNPFHTQNLSDDERKRRADIARERFSQRAALLN